MHKTLLTLALLVGLTGAANAQRSIRARSQASSGLSLGVKAGGSNTSLIGEDATIYENIYGYHAGVFANITLSKHIGFQPELMFSQKGAKYPPAGGGDLATRRLNYLDIPLSFHLNTGGFFLEAGPQIGILLNAQDKIGSITYPVKRDYFTDAEFGFLGGLGYQRKSGLGIGLRYNGGLTSIRKGVSNGTVTVQERARNSALQLYLTYSFNATK